MGDQEIAAVLQSVGDKAVWLGALYVVMRFGADILFIVLGAIGVRAAWKYMKERE